MMMNNEKCKFILSDRTYKTRLLGATLASVCIKGCVMYVSGNVGAGKSVFCTGFLRKLGYIGHVNSPTYTLVESYIVNGWCVHHFDFYRLCSSEDLENIGFRDFFDGNAICLIEWPKQNIRIIPKADISVTVNYCNMDVNVRKIIIRFISNVGKDMWQSLFFSWDLFKCISDTKFFL